MNKFSKWRKILFGFLLLIVILTLMKTEKYVTLSVPLSSIVHQHSTLSKNQKCNLHKHIYDSVSIFPSKLAEFVRVRLLETLQTDTIPSQSSCSNPEIFSSSLRNMTSRILGKLSDEIAAEYPITGDLKDISKRRLAREYVRQQQINTNSYQYVYNPSGTCKNVDLDLLVVVKSAVEHYHLRHVIRRTWAKDFVLLKSRKTTIVFLLGYSDKERYMVSDENLLYGDIIQGNFIDKYRNNTMKTIMGFNWITLYCKNAKFILFVDDDVIVNVDRTEHFISSVSENLETDLYSGMAVRGGIPIRDKQSKWFIHHEEYPYLIYPDYIAGCVIIMSQNAVRKFQSVFRYVKYLPFDDVFLGIVARKLRIEIHDNKLLANVYQQNFTIIKGTIANHGFQDEELLFKTYNEFFTKS